MQGQQSSTRDIVYIALFAGLTAALSLFPPITIPAIGVPISAQSLGPMLAGSILGARRGGLALLLFVGLVAVGLPLLSGGRGGLGVFFGPSGGYIIGWVVAAYVIGLLHEWGWRRLNVVSSFIYCVIGAIIVLYAIGITWTSFVVDLSLLKTAMASSLFVIGDVIKAGVAAAIAVSVKRSYPIIQKTAVA
ncbi:biotin transport system substrate-specific component [Breoghania corrubedonensis]|uniref:Biotin transporter n=1 Tax=Breoghania corrubedonensis TaxID=665038 RepID=A0A2T5V9G6_9HYPH|nr:biotin transporter BioY [Breoghania corrubedonensis]PTW60399.1 biotin transport system substrate-specific component [Breoghania corrubedonensis]